jgi:hypothetical protein
MSKKKKRRKVNRFSSDQYNSSASENPSGSRGNTSGQIFSITGGPTPSPPIHRAPRNIGPVAVAGRSSAHGPQEARSLPADVPIFGPDQPPPCLFFLTITEAQALAKQG